MQSVLITGASSGFGQLTAIELTRLGWRVFAAMRDPDGGAVLKDAVGALGLTERLHLIRMDVTQASSIDGAVAQVLAITGGTLDAILNNAGFTTMGFFEDMSDSQARSVMETNFFGAVAVTRAAVPIMRRAGHGRIVFVSSNAVNCPHPTMTMYAASKWALEGFAEGLAMELAPFGVEVVVLQPGNHRTPFGSNVKVIQPPASAYGALWQALMPGLEALGSNGAEPANALPAFVQSIVEPRPPFLLPIGRDVKLFSRLKRRMRSFEARASAVRHLVGFPGRHRP
jgi:NAD(P)-dependent dehydrogenase (short-subunit alcohol dehydrogenase family)